MVFCSKQKREVDFVVLKDRKPVLFVETKHSDNEISDSFRYLKRKFEDTRAIQVVHDLDKQYINKDNIEVLSFVNFLKELI